MKKKNLFTAFVVAVSLWVMRVVPAAEEATQVAGSFTIWHALRFFGYFFLVMGLIFAALLFTGWLGKLREKHKK